MSEQTELGVVQREPTPMDMIRLAMDQDEKPDLEWLEKFMQLQQRHEADKARKAFNQAMAAAQAEMPVVVRDAVNTSTGSRYARMENVQKRIKPIYLSHGFTVSVSETEPPGPGRIRIKAVVRHTGGHVEEYFRDGPVDSKGPKGNPTKSELHGAQSTVTYLTRNLLFGVFGVTVANEDDDGCGEAAPRAISEEQAIRIEDIVSQLPEARQQKFMAWLAQAAGVEKVHDIPEPAYNNVFGKLKAAMARD